MNDHDSETGMKSLWQNLCCYQGCKGSTVYDSVLGVALENYPFIEPEFSVICLLVSWYLAILSRGNGGFCLCGPSFLSFGKQCDGCVVVLA